MLRTALIAAFLVAAGVSADDKKPERWRHADRDGRHESAKEWRKARKEREKERRKVRREAAREARKDRHEYEKRRY